MSNQLSPKDELFCQLYASGDTTVRGNASEAYRRSRNSKAKPESVHPKASHLMATDKVKTRIAEITQELADAALWSREESIKILADIAKGGSPVETIGDLSSAVKPSDQINAVKTINSMYGWDKQIIDQTITHKVEKSLSERLSGGSKR